VKLTSKNWVSTLINIIGLSIALAVFMVLMVQVRWDWTYDKGYKDADRIVRFEHDFFESGEFSTWSSRPFIEVTKGVSPNIEVIGTRDEMGEVVWYPEDQPDHKISIEAEKVDEGLLDVFSFDIVEGSKNIEEGYCIISQSAAKKLFGDGESAIGKVLKSDDWNDFQVAGVYKDFPRNSSIPNGIFVSLGDKFLHDSSEWSFTAYAKLKDVNDASQTIDALIPTWKDDLAPEQEEDEAKKFFKSHFRFKNIHDTHFSRDMDAKNIVANKAVTNTLFAIGLLILIIAIINFINFAFASIPFNIKSINTRRVYGASKTSLIGGQLLKAIVIALISYCLAILIMKVLSGTSLAGTLLTSIKPKDNVFILIITFGLAIVLALLAGISPAIYSTSQPTAMVLKGSYAMSAKGRGLRNILVGLQFTLSFIFIIFALYIGIQIKYLKTKDMGFKHEEILEVIHDDRVAASNDAYKSQLLQNPAIIDVTFSDTRLVSKSRMHWGREVNSQPMYSDVLPVSTNFLDFFGMEIVDGRDFRESDNDNTCGTMIVNQTLVNEYPFVKVGGYILGHSDEGPAEVVGIVKDFNFKPLQYGIAPMILYNFGSTPWRDLRCSYVKMAAGSNPKDVMDYIRQTVCQFDPNQTPEAVRVNFLDDSTRKFYENETALGHMISLASIVALIIALIGVIGLVFFETQFMRKEIALRRVNGATVESILAKINRKYLIIAAVSFVFSVPIAYYMIVLWKKGFAYQAAIPVWIFILALVIVAIVTVLVVTLQSWKAANANPVDALRNE